MTNKVKKEDINKVKKEDINKVVDYLKEQDGWTLLRRKDVEKLIDKKTTMSIYTLRSLKDLKNVEYRKAQNYNVQGPKPFEFRYIKETKAIDKDESKKEDLMDVKKYPNLKGSEIALVVRTLKDSIISTENISKSLKILNALKSITPDSGKIVDYTTKLSDRLILSHNVVKFYIRILRANNLIAIDADNSLRITLDPTTDNIQQEISILTEDKLNEDKQEEKESGQNDYIYKNLIENLDDFKGFVENFQDFIIRSKEDIVVKNTVDTSQLEDLQEELSDGNEVLTKCLAEKEQLEAELERTRENLNKQKKMNELYRRQNEDFYNTMYERFQIVIAEITNLVSEHNQLPDWKKSPTLNAKFQNNVVSAITSSIDDILRSEKDK